MQHIAVLIGYAFDATVPSVIVNDPFPFDVAPYAQRGNPYLAQGGVRFWAGQYRVPLSGLVRGLVRGLGWANASCGIQ